MCNTHPRYGKQLMRSSTGSESVPNRYRKHCERWKRKQKCGYGAGAGAGAGAGFYPLRPEKGL